MIKKILNYIITFIIGTIYVLFLCTVGLVVNVVIIIVRAIKKPLD